MKVSKKSDIANLKFHITDDMHNAFIEMLLIKEMLENPNNDKNSKRLLEKQYNELNSFFVNEFKKNNITERKMYHEFMNQ